MNVDVWTAASRIAGINVSRNVIATTIITAVI
jgi:predicted secreted protein